MIADGSRFFYRSVCRLLKNFLSWRLTLQRSFSRVGTQGRRRHRAKHYSRLGNHSIAHNERNRSIYHRNIIRYAPNFIEATAHPRRRLRDAKLSDDLSRLADTLSRAGEKLYHRGRAPALWPCKDHQRIQR